MTDLGLYADALICQDRHKLIEASTLSASMLRDRLLQVKDALLRRDSMPALNDDANPSYTHAAITTRATSASWNELNTDANVRIIL